MPNPLGTCQHQPPGAEYPCGGDLCISTEAVDAKGQPMQDGAVLAAIRTVVKCEMCGNEVKDHPETKLQPQATQPRPVDVRTVVKREDFPRSLDERLKALEDGMKAQGAKIATLQAKLAGNRRTVEAG